MGRKDCFDIGQQIDRGQALAKVAKVVANRLPRSAQGADFIIAEARFELGCRSDCIGQPCRIIPGGKNFSRGIEWFDPLTMISRLSVSKSTGRAT